MNRQTNLSLDLKIIKFLYCFCRSRSGLKASNEVIVSFWRKCLSCLYSTFAGWGAGVADGRHEAGTLKALGGIAGRVEPPSTPVLLTNEKLIWINNKVFTRWKHIKPQLSQTGLLAVETLGNCYPCCNYLYSSQHYTYLAFRRNSNNLCKQTLFTPKCSYVPRFLIHRISNNFCRQRILNKQQCVTAWATDTYARSTSTTRHTLNRSPLAHPGIWLCTSCLLSWKFQESIS